MTTYRINTIKGLSFENAYKKAKEELKNSEKSTKISFMFNDIECFVNNDLTYIEAFDNYNTEYYNSNKNKELEINFYEDDVLLFSVNKQDYLLFDKTSNFYYDNCCYQIKDIFHIIKNDKITEISIYLILL